MVEALRWRKSTRSNSQGNCVEVAASAGRVLVRDSKDRSGPVLTFGPAGWAAFIADLKQHEPSR